VSVGEITGGGGVSVSGNGVLVGEAVGVFVSGGSGVSGDEVGVSDTVGGGGVCGGVSVSVA
jgi:hypothetical protein